MTPEEQARALADSVLLALGRNPMDFGGYIANERFGKEECIKAMLPVIAAGLREARREVWGEAAKGIEDGVDVKYECGPSNWQTFKSNDCKRMATWCREQM